MSEGKKKASSVLVAILIAAVLSLIVSLVRLYGEVQGWAPTIFSTEAGGGGSPLGITWLVLVFGFWFGRRLARDGSRPRSTLLAFVLPIVGIVITMVTFMLVLGKPSEMNQLTAEQWRTSIIIINITVVVCGLTTLIAWPRAWLVLVFYGILARIPVILIQNYAVSHGWGTHFEKGPPGMPDEIVLWALTMAQSLFWPLGWTPCIGGLFAALGALTVRAGGKEK